MTMVHGDNQGLVLPPRVASIQVMFQFTKQAAVFQRVVDFIQQINRYPEDKIHELEDIKIHWIVIYPLDKVIQSLSTQARSSSQAFKKI